MSRILTNAEIGRLTNVTAQLGPWAMPIVQALRCGIIGVQMLRRTDRAPLADMRRCSLPLLLWLGDDDDQPTGPDNWRPALTVIRWCRGALLHAAGGEASHYETAVMGTLVTGRFLLVETSTQHVEAWADALGSTPTMIIVPPNGNPHPAPQQVTHH